MLRTSLTLSLTLLFGVACRSAEPEPPEPGLAGQLQLDVFHVPPGETVWVDGDLVVSATTAIVVEGRLVARDAAELGLRDAPTIELVSALVIDVPGEVLGGRGFDAQRTPGGAGSSVVLTAPLVRVHGRVEAGPGGQGGRSLPGGKGGNALVHGFLEGSDEVGHVALRSGTGGRGGESGGDGGPSGDAIARAPDDLRERMPELRARALAELARLRREP